MFDSLIEKFITELQILPGIGERSARRMAIQLFANPQAGKRLAYSMTETIQKVGKCDYCRNYTVQKLCVLCQNDKRSSDRLCVVTTPQDLSAVEASDAFNGKYFVLHHLFSPLNNIGVKELDTERFEQCLHGIKELILALPYTIEGEITASLLIKIAKPLNIRITQLAQGLPAGGEVSGMDSLTLNYALSKRNPVDKETVLIEESPKTLQSQVR